MTDADSPNGTFHVRVLRAAGLPVDYEKRQDPIVLVELDGPDGAKTVGTTDPAAQGGANPEWTERQNRDVELFFDAAQHPKEAVLTFEVYSDEAGENLVGTGQINVAKIAQTKNTTPTDFTVRLKDTLGGTTNRGEVKVQVWFGPPVRKAFRAAQRLGKLLDARDSVVSSVWALGLQTSAPLAKRLKGPADYLKKNRKLSMALAAFLGVIAAGIAGIFALIALPTAIVAAFTFPFWILPFLVAAFFTAPLWLPIVLLVAVFLAFVSAMFVGLGVTSRPVRRKGALLSSRIKHSDMGKRVVYEKTE